MRAISAELVVDEKSRTALVWRHENVLIPLNTEEEEVKLRSLSLAIFGGMIHTHTKGKKNSTQMRTSSGLSQIFVTFPLRKYFSLFVFLCSAVVVKYRHQITLIFSRTESTPTFQS
jgi:hypothetical protein